MHPKAPTILAARSLDLPVSRIAERLVPPLHPNEPIADHQLILETQQLEPCTHDISFEKKQAVVTYDDAKSNVESL
jgi:hypothetical protein